MIGFCHAPFPGQKVPLEVPSQTGLCTEGRTAPLPHPRRHGRRRVDVVASSVGNTRPPASDPPRRSRGRRKKEEEEAAAAAAAAAALLITRGQNEAIQELSKFFRETWANRLPRRLLFVGADGTGKAAVADWFLSELRERGLVAEYQHFGRDARERVVRQYIQSMAGEGAEEHRVPPVAKGVVIPDTLLSRESIRTALGRRRREETGPQPCVEILLVQEESMSAEAMHPILDGGYKIPFYPLDDEECRDVLRALGRTDVVKTDLALAYSHGCYEHAIQAFEWMRAKMPALPWDLLRAIPPFPRAAGVPRLTPHAPRQGQPSQEKKGGGEIVPFAGSVSVSQAVAMANDIAVALAGRIEDQKQLITFLDHVWAGDMDRWIMAAETEPGRREKVLEVGVHSHLMLKDALEALERGASPDLLWGVALTRSATYLDEDDSSLGS